VVANLLGRGFEFGVGSKVVRDGVHVLGDVECDDIRTVARVLDSV